MFYSKKGDWEPERGILLGQMTDEIPEGYAISSMASQQHLYVRPQKLCGPNGQSRRRQAQDSVGSNNKTYST